MRKKAPGTPYGGSGAFFIPEENGIKSAGFAGARFCFAWPVTRVPDFFSLLKEAPYFFICKAKKRKRDICPRSYKSDLACTN